MADNDISLSEEELSALSEDLHMGQDKVINASGSSMAISHDLTKEDSSLGFNQSAVDLVNERFARQLRMGLIEVLRTTPRINVNSIKIKQFSESTAALQTPLAISTVRMEPLRGLSLIVIDPKIIFSALDSFFGGFGKGIDSLSATRIFTPTEDTIIQLLMNIIFASLKEAWSPIIQVDFQRVSQEVNPAFAQIADEDELMLVSRFDFALEDNESGFIQIIQPFSLLKPIRDLLRSRVQTTDDEDEQSTRWITDLQDACEELPVALNVKIAEIETTYGDLQEMKNGDILPLEINDSAELMICDSIAFLGTVGEMDGQLAVEVNSRYVEENK